ncbi:MAG: ABC transporter permease, partial [Rubrivivax sp.]
MSTATASSTGAAATSSTSGTPGVLGRIGRGALFPLAVLLFWEFAARSGLLKAESLSFPTAIFKAAVGVVLD